MAKSNLTKRKGLEWFKRQSYVGNDGVSTAVCRYVGRWADMIEDVNRELEAPLVGSRMADLLFETVGEGEFALTRLALRMSKVEGWTWSANDRGRQAMIQAFQKPVFGATGCSVYAKPLADPKPRQPQFCIVVERGQERGQGSE